MLTPFPFTDLTQSKVRPALVLADVRDMGESDWIVCEITTSTLTHAREIVLSSGDMRTGRLRTGSKVRTDRIATLDERIFLRTIGRLSDDKQAEIAEAVRGLF